MNELKNSFKNQIKNIWFLWIYLSLVVISHLYLYFDGLEFYALAIVGVVGSYFVADVLMQALSGSQRQVGSFGETHPYNIQMCSRTRTIYFVILFVYGLTLIFYRNHMVTDFNKSFYEAMSDNYTDWHPVIFTLIFAKLPISIVEILHLPIDPKHATFIFYEFIRAFVLSFAISDIEKYLNKKIAIITLLYYMFMPLSIHSIVSQTKGTAMGEFFILGFLILLKTIYIKDYNDVNKKIEINRDVLIGLFFALSLLMRKNGILFFAFIFLGIIFTLPKIKTMRIIISFVATIIIITKIIYSFFNITYLPKAHNTHELLGLPLTVISAFMKYDEDNVDNETKEFALLLVNGDRKFYEGYNIKIGYNSVRWAEGFDTNHAYEVFEKYDGIKVLKYAINLTKKNPKLALRSIINLTKGVYGFRNWQGVTQQNGKILGKNIFINIYQFFLSLEVALINLIIIASVFAKKLFDKKNIFNLCLCLAVLCYNFGTGLLLSTADSTHYFMISSMSLPLILISIYNT